MINPRFIKFLIVGCSNTLLSFLVFYWASTTFFETSLFYAQCTSYLAGVLWSYAWNSLFTFESKINSADFFRFSLTQVSMMVLSAFLISHLTKVWSDINLNIVWLLVMLFITVLNYSLCKYFVFRVKESKEAL
jgi:putative flippase GtrA